MGIIILYNFMYSIKYNQSISFISDISFDSPSFKTKHLILFKFSIKKKIKLERIQYYEKSLKQLKVINQEGVATNTTCFSLNILLNFNDTVRIMPAIVL